MKKEGAESPLKKRFSLPASEILGIAFHSYVSSPCLAILLSFFDG